MIGTTSLPEEMRSALELTHAFNTVLNVPALKKNDVIKVLKELDMFAPVDVDPAATALDEAVNLLNEEVRGRGCGGGGGGRGCVVGFMVVRNVKVCTLRPG